MALSRLFQARKNTPSRFSVDLPSDDVCRILTAACEAQTIHRRRPFVSDGAYGDYVQSAARWLSDPAAPCALLMRGNAGNGKTTLMKAIEEVVNRLYFSPINNADNPKIYIYHYKARELARLASSEKGRAELRRIASTPMIAIDDLGDEAKLVIDYGSPIQPLVELLEERYDRQLFTLFTSNLTSRMIEDHYGARIRDRLREFCHIINFENKSFR